MKTVAVLIPLSWDVVPQQFFFSVLGMMAYSRDKYDMTVLTARAAHPALMHERMIEQLEGQDVDYILHLDADQEYPHDTPEKMMAHIDSGKDVVMGFVSQNRGNGCVAYDMQMEPLQLHQMKLQPNSGLVQVTCTGMGGLMVNPTVYEKLDPPYFQGLPGFSGPDVNLCYKCNKAGIKMWVDTDLRFGHIVSEAKYL